MIISNIVLNYFSKKIQQQEFFVKLRSWDPILVFGETGYTLRHQLWQGLMMNSLLVDKGFAMMEWVTLRRSCVEEREYSIWSADKV